MTARLETHLIFQLRKRASEDAERLSALRKQVTGQMENLKWAWLELRKLKRHRLVLAGVDVVLFLAGVAILALPRCG
jgi:hypothetical protein